MVIGKQVRSVNGSSAGSLKVHRQATVNHRMILRAGTIGFIGDFESSETNY